MIRYTVTPADPAAHLFAVALRVPRPDPGGQVFRLPAWIRGSYLVRDFAKHVVEVRAESAGRPVAIERVDKSTLRCAPCAGALTLEYTVYAYDESVRKAYLDDRRGFFNGSSLYYAAVGGDGQIEVELRRAEGPGATGWRAFTAMRALQVDADGFGTYRCEDYEEALDHPVELGDHARVDFDVDGIPHAFVLAGRCDLDRERLARDTLRICHVQRELFGQEPKLDRYLFLTRVVASGYGGLEHRASTALICSRNDLPRPGVAALTREYRAFLGLVSHEYFHLWNVKRITPGRFAASDLTAEAYTSDLWHYEGITSYYDDLMLLRAGILDVSAYLDLIAETATRLSRTPGRRVQSLADASFEAWTKYYQPDENSSNATISYYVKGALVALCIDLFLRRHGGTTLDEVMREMWRRYGRIGAGVPERGLERVVAELSQRPLAVELDRWIRSTEDLPLAELLAEFGVDARPRAALGDADPGGRVSGKPQGATLGLKLKGGDTAVASVLAGGAAQRAGVSAGDVLVALDGLRVGNPQWPLRLAALKPGQSCELQYFRGDELLRATLTADPLPLDAWTVTLADAPGAEALARRKAWLGA